MKVALFYSVRAELLNAYDDSTVGSVSGRVEVGHSEGTEDKHETTVQATMGDLTATAAGRVNTGHDLRELERQAIWAATIGNGANPGCQLGGITYGRTTVCTA